MKKSLRSIYLRKREEIHNDELDTLIVNKLLNHPSYQNSDSIFVTLSFGSEINTLSIIDQALKDHKKVYVPKVDQNKKTMYPVEITSLEDDLIEGPYNILEPKKTKLAEKIPDLAIVPGLIFSEDGFRVGYGGGYYDRYLDSNELKTVSLSYEDLVLESVPVESFDKRVDQIITEKRVIEIY